MEYKKNRKIVRFGCDMAQKMTCNCVIIFRDVTFFFYFKAKDLDPRKLICQQFLSQHF